MANMTAAQTKYCLKSFPKTISILIKGEHGRGKSETVAQVAKECKESFIDLRLSQNDVGDMKGMPFHVNGKTIFAPPDWFPIKKEDAKELQAFLGLTNDIIKGRFGDKGILFLDELNRASIEVQQAAFELVLDRRLNMRSLPDGWRVVAAINANDNNTDIYKVNEMGMALNQRFFILDFNPSVDEWLEWSSDNCVHESVTQLIRRTPDMLDPTPELLKETVLKGVIKLHDRRSWVKLSTTIKKLEKDFEDGLTKVHPLDKSRENLDMLLLIASGFVGNMASVKYVQFVETNYQALDANVILNGWNKDIKDKLTKIVTAGRIPEIGAYNADIIDFIDKKIKGNLTKKQGENLQKYLSLLNRETVADLWMSANEVCSEKLEHWYNSSKKNQEVIVQAIMKNTVKA
jgi:hypothetical protein